MKICRPKDTTKPTVDAKRGEPVRVHRNLHNGCWVVSTKRAGGWKVSGYATGVTLKNVRPRVGASRYEACKRDKVRNVHAYLEGDLVKVSAGKPKGWKQITYNCKTGPGPYFYDSKTRKKFTGAREVRLVQSKDGKSAVYVKGSAALENPPPCPCEAGTCSCGLVDSETPHEDEPSCGDPGGAEGVACVQCGPSLVLLDVGAIKRISPERFWEDSCPCVLGYAGPGGITSRQGWETALEYAEPEDSAAVLGWVAGQLGGTPAEVEEHLLRNGEGWVAHELARGRVNPAHSLTEGDWEDPVVVAMILWGDLHAGDVTPEEVAAHLPRLQALAAESGDPFEAQNIEELRQDIESAKALRDVRERAKGARNLHLRSLKPGGWEKMIHPAVRTDAPAGYWQLTEFGFHSQGNRTLIPWGHSNHPSLDAAIVAAWEDHGPYEIVAKANPGRRRARPPRPRSVALPASIPVTWAVGPRAGDLKPSTRNQTRGWELIVVPIDGLFAATAGSQRLNLDDPSPDRVWRAKWHWSQGGAIDPAQLGLSAGGPIMFDDGRHRLVAAWQLGERLAPVLVPPGEAQEILYQIGGPGPLVNPAPRWRVRSARQGLNAIKAKEITKNYRAALRFKPKSRVAVLLPCAQTKPFTEAPSYTGGYLQALEGKDADLWVVSEPLGVVPFAWSEKFPNAHYDFPPKYLTGEARDLLAERVAQWFKTVAPKYSKVVIALPAHHARLVESALEILGERPRTSLSYAGIGDCLDSGTCPSGHYRATSEAYRGYLRKRVRSNPPSWALSLEPTVGPMLLTNPKRKLRKTKGGHESQDRWHWHDPRYLSRFYVERGVRGYNVHDLKLDAYARCDSLHECGHWIELSLADDPNPG